MDVPMNYDEKLKRCKTCMHYRERDEHDGSWMFPCDQCLGSIATLVDPKKDYYEKGNRTRKFNVCYYRCGDHESIEEPARFMVVYGQDEKEIKSKFNYAYRHLKYTFGWAEAIDAQ